MKGKKYKYKTCSLSMLSRLNSFWIQKLKKNKLAKRDQSIYDKLYIEDCLKVLIKKKVDLTYFFLKLEE